MTCRLVIFIRVPSFINIVQSPFPWETTDFNVVALKMPGNFLEISSQFTSTARKVNNYFTVLSHIYQYYCPEGNQMS